MKQGKKLTRIANISHQLYTYAIHVKVRVIQMATSTVFINNRTQAVRLPSEMRLPEGIKQVSVRSHGKERIIAPLGESWDSFFLDTPPASPDFMDTRASQDQSGREKF
jgi:antitoxin VapB